ncbi:hypothetical protein DTO013E5_5046 [Penicillium roqueforti]|nr:hypothetical protein DTO012A1_3585 [Penicillium roqueforti]KAI2755529.1 hypothetical protein DTO013F2_1212 [Penicillium roqueforti]KAI3172998.1 hypothetical protein DTO046C5_3345 [Penicillium roqueforti]KAI3210761.1 hypothetical protein DTO013E5_5046 [Penicillium roqueforti]
MSHDHVLAPQQPQFKLRVGTIHTEIGIWLTQQIQATSGISHELAQQQMGEAVRSALVNAEQQHEERVKLLKQTHLGELTAVKVDNEGKLTKATAESKAETALSQQREVCEGATQ